MIMRKNKKGIFSRIKKIGKSFLKGAAFTAGFHTLFFFVPGMLSPAFLIPSLIKGGVFWSLLDTANELAEKLYLHILENKVVYEIA